MVEEKKEEDILSDKKFVSDHKDESIAIIENLLQRKIDTVEGEEIADAMIEVIEQQVTTNSRKVSVQSQLVYVRKLLKSNILINKLGPDIRKKILLAAAKIDKENKLI